MVAERATAPESAAPCSDQNNQGDDITMCAICGDDRHVYQLGDGQWVCLEHIGLVISLAANDLFSGDVHYTKAFETAVLM